MSLINKTLKASATALTLAFTSAAMVTGGGFTNNSAVQAGQTQSASQLIEDSWNAYSRTRQAGQLTRYVDFNTFSQVTLGPDWRSASQAQRQEFADVYERYIIKQYAQKLRGYAGGTIETRERPGRRGNVTVSATINKAGKSPLDVEYSMYKSGSSWRVYNVKIEGISLSNHFRGEFNRIMDREGGLDGLIDYLERRADLDLPNPHLFNGDENRSEFALIEGHEAIRPGQDHFETSISIG